jgi:spore cortex formation protein SpoVR/YcgB (stage V sporulation)
MKGFMNDEKDYTFVSEQISKEAMNKFNYFKFKDEFQTLLKGWL